MRQAYCQFSIIRRGGFGVDGMRPVISWKFLEERANVLLELLGVIGLANEFTVRKWRSLNLAAESVIENAAAINLSKI